MDKIKVRIVNKSNNPLPEYGTPGSAGMDVRAWLESPVTIEPMQRRIIPTGIYMQIPQGYECQIRPRSGLAAKYGITVLNTPGTIDSDYRGEVCVILVNLSDKAFEITSGERICQMVFAACPQAEWEATETLDETTRGTGGFGHTGLK